MPNSPHHVPAWPLYRLQADASGAVTVTGPAAPHGPYDSRTGAVAAVAAAIPRTVRAEAVEADGATVPLVIHPDGTAETTGPTRRPPKRRQRERPGETAREPETRQVPTPAEPEPTAQAPAPVAEPLPAPRGPDDNPPATPLRIHEPQPPEATAGPAVSAAVGAIQRAVHAGHLDEALRLAAQADDALARTHGPSHTEALKAREVRAHIASLRGEFSAAALLYRDSAERWQIQGEAQQADEAAGRAHALWLKISDTAEAIRTGEAIIRMRQQIPGPAMAAYQQAQQHQDALHRRACQHHAATTTTP